MHEAEHIPQAERTDFDPPEGVEDPSDLETSDEDLDDEFDDDDDLDEDELDDLDNDTEA